VGDSYDNALAESVIGLYKLECVRRDGPFRGVDDLELATTYRDCAACAAPPPAGW
jgi:putative transposase